MIVYPPVPSSLRSKTGSFEPVFARGTETHSFTPDRISELDLSSDPTIRANCQKAVIAFHELNSILGNANAHDTLEVLAASVASLQDERGRTLAARYAGLRTGMIQLDHAPFSLDILRELHARAAVDSCTEEHLGRIRTKINWVNPVNGSPPPFVCAPVDDLNERLADLVDLFNRSPKDTEEAIVTAGLLQLQMFTLHPFKDGNGRTTRLLVPLYLWKHGILTAPLLDLSAILRQYRGAQSVMIKMVCLKYDWSHWLDFFFDMVEASVEQFKNVLTASARIEQGEDVTKVAKSLAQDMNVKTSRLRSEAPDIQLSETLLHARDLVKDHVT